MHVLPYVRLSAPHTGEYSAVQLQVPFSGGCEPVQPKTTRANRARMNAFMRLLSCQCLKKHNGREEQRAGADAVQAASGGCRVGPGAVSPAARVRRGCRAGLVLGGRSAVL